MGSNKRISLERLQPKFEMLIRNWVEDRKAQGMTQEELANMVGVHPSHLSNLICRENRDDPNSAYRRPLTAFYVEPFLDRGVFTMDQFYEVAPGTPEREKKWALRMKFSHTKQGEELILEAARLVQEGHSLQRVIDFMRGVRSEGESANRHISKPIKSDESVK